MAFGLAELPRLIWKKANHKSHFVWCTVKVGKKAERLETARAELMRVSAVVNATATNMSRRDPLLPLMQRVVDYCEQRGGRALHRQPGGGRGAGGAADDVTLTDDELDYGNDMQVRRVVAAHCGVRGYQPPPLSPERHKGRVPSSLAPSAFGLWSSSKPPSRLWSPGSGAFEPSRQEGRVAVRGHQVRVRRGRERGARYGGHPSLRARGPGGCGRAHVAPTRRAVDLPMLRRAVGPAAGGPGESHANRPA